jgi:uncharacterized Zn finger protein
MPDVRLACASCGSHVLVAPDETVKKCGTCGSFHLVPLDTAPHSARPVPVRLYRRAARASHGSAVRALGDRPKLV